jgi:hypothetical protein
MDKMLYSSRDGIDREASCYSKMLLFILEASQGVLRKGHEMNIPWHFQKSRGRGEQIRGLGTSMYMTDIGLLSSQLVDPLEVIRMRSSAVSCRTYCTTLIQSLCCHEIYWKRMH